MATRHRKPSTTFGLRNLWQTFGRTGPHAHGSPKSFSTPSSESEIVSVMVVNWLPVVLNGPMLMFSMLRPCAETMSLELSIEFPNIERYRKPWCSLGSKPFGFAGGSSTMTVRLQCECRASSEEEEYCCLHYVDKETVTATLLFSFNPIDGHKSTKIQLGATFVV